ncbi:MAG: hypothetical protein MUC69_07190 [Gemmatimonadales bacterium]|nr:hypothetical protein [Gemmatimonadales bacterium]
MTLSRLAVALTVAGVVLAGIAVLARVRWITWVAIVFVAAALAARWLDRRRGVPDA